MPRSRPGRIGWATRSRALGLETENRVLLALVDSAEFVTAFFGAIKLGAIPVPVNTNLGPDDYATLLRRQPGQDRHRQPVGGQHVPGDQARRPHAAAPRRRR